MHWNDTVELFRLTLIAHFSVACQEQGSRGGDNSSLLWKYRHAKLNLDHLSLLSFLASASIAAEVKSSGIASRHVRTELLQIFRLPSDDNF